MHGTVVLTSLALLNTPAAALPAAHQVSGKPKPDRGVVTQPYGYIPFAKSPGSHGHASEGGNGGKSFGTATAGGKGQTTPTYCSAPGPFPTKSTCGGNGTEYGIDLPTDAKPGSAAPTVTPAELAQQAYSRLVLPKPSIRTAPPRGKNGLVGLRHFFWADRSGWRPMTQRAEAGGVWAEVTATPTSLVVKPGNGDTVRCDGPGTPYDFSRRPDGQDTGCTYLYRRSSFGLPGSAYQVSAGVLWTATWVGSGGTGGALPSLTRSSGFSVRVAEGQALTQRRP